MQYTSADISHLCFQLQNIDFELNFYSLAGTYLGSNKKGGGPAGAPAKLAAQTVSMKEDCPVPGTKLTAHLCRLEGEPAFYVVMPGTTAPLAAPYVDSLLPLIFGHEAEETRSYTRELRTRLTSQLANFSDLTNEPESIIQTLGYSSNTWRAALLCSVPLSNVREAGENPGATQGYNIFFSECVENCAAYHADDIFGMMSNNQFLVFKTVPSGSYLTNAAYLEGFLQDLVRHLGARVPGPLVFGVGSAYDSLAQLNMSYREAAFLLDNAAFLAPDGKDVLFLNDYLMEYLAYAHLSAKSEVVFRDYNALGTQRPILEHTAIALSQNDYVLSRTGEQLDIHRNTMIQRYHKLARTLQIDPVRQVSDRVLLRTQLLPRVCAVTWNAGVHIQASSVQYNGLIKLSEVLYRKSHGTMRLNVHHISTAGDNAQLLKIIGNGSLDLGSCACSVLYSISEELASLIEQPFLFDSVEQAFALLNGLILPSLRHELRNLPVLCPAFWVIGSRHITSRDAPIRKPEDLRGLSIRTMSTGALYQYFLRLGAQPVHIVYSEVRRALRTGLVDCQENPYSNILGIELYDVQHYINSMVYYYNISPLFVSKESWNKLTPEQQGYLGESIRETTDWLVREQASLNARCKDILEHEKGMKIVAPTEAERRLWLREAKAMQTAHPLQKQLRTLLKAKEVYSAKGTLEADLPNLLHGFS